ncbi:MAG: uridine diphosphate-N-acetylglucosamine-binding protein YvcK, partial [Candidatus Anammoxibacter sp.]
MKIKAIIFDLDDTLYDCTGMLTDASRRRAAKAMVEAGIPCTEEEIYRIQNEAMEQYGPYYYIFNEIAKKYGASQDVVQKALQAYNSSEVSNIKPFSDVIPTLKQLKKAGFKLFLVTVGVHQRQEKKIELLGINDQFDEIIVSDQEVGLLLEECYEMLLKRYNLNACEVAVVGDRVREELRIGKAMGMTTIRMLHGRFKLDSRSNQPHNADYKVKRIFQVPTVVSLINIGKTPDMLKVVAIGGGTGLPIALEGIKTYSNSVTGIVAVTDSGRSSGVLREQYGILPPGDARNCLIALSESEEQEQDLYNLFQYRFDKGSLKGMSLGNLLMTALTDITGSFDKAIKKASKILSINGKVLPATLTNTHICAELEDGTYVEEEYNVRSPQKSAIKNVTLKKKDVEALPEAIDDIRDAEIIIIGPGSLYTSVITNLLIEGIRNAIKESNAIKIYVCNIVSQPGQSDNYNVSDHIKSVQKYLGEGVLDFVIVNNNTPDNEILKRYKEKGSGLVTLDSGIKDLKPMIKETDLVEDIQAHRILWEKADMLRHDPDKLADSVCRIYAKIPLYG